MRAPVHTLLRSPMRSTTPRQRLAWLAAAIALVCVLLLAGPPAPAAGDDDGELGFVFSVEGQASIVALDGSRRAAVCHEPIRDGERVVTAEGARLGALAGDALVHVDTASDVGFARADDGGALLDLERGALRAIDGAGAVAAAPPVRVQTPNARARARGADLEASVLAEKGGLYSMLCSWDQPLELARRAGDEHIRAAPGACAFAKPRQPLYTAPARGHRVALASDAPCRPRDVIGAAAPRFRLADVAAPPPPAVEFLGPLDPDQRTNSPCDDPGGLCDPAIEAAPPPITPVEPPIVPEDPPGAPGFGG